MYPYKRIMLFGRPGSGKSTFAKKLHIKTGLPLYHLDAYFYDACWVERDYQDFLNDQQDIVNQDRWIVDGNCTSSLEMRYARADLCLYFNIPRFLCLYRILKRRVSKDRSIADRAEGCDEIISWKLITYMWTFKKRVNKKITFLKNMYPHVTFVEIHNASDLQKILSANKV